jgi:hypothetical protein
MSALLMLMLLLYSFAVLVDKKINKYNELRREVKGAQCHKNIILNRQIPKAKKTVMLSVFFALLGSSCKKADLIERW